MEGRRIIFIYGYTCCVEEYLAGSSNCPRIYRWKSHGGFQDTGSREQGESVLGFQLLLSGKTWACLLFSKRVSLWTKLVVEGCCET